MSIVAVQSVCKKQSVWKSSVH